MLEHLHLDLHNLLHCSLEEPGNECNTKEAYKVYGLLLSACPLKSVIEKVCALRAEILTLKFIIGYYYCSK